MNQEKNQLEPGIPKIQTGEMPASESLYRTNQYPKIIVWIRSLYLFFERLFEHIRVSRHNPVAYAGTLAVFFLAVVILSGFYLIFFYKISSPYQSIVDIQNSKILLRWARAMHRYASDGVVIAAFFHVAKLLAQGRSWGPRVLSWMTGIFMIGSLFVSAFTGYVSVWDEHGKEIAIWGAKILDLFPIFPESFLRTFSGEKSPDSAFFFMNIFAHIAVPLILIIGLWLHTSRLSKPSYLPDKKNSILYVLFILAVAVIFPAPLLPQADLFSSRINFPIDGFYSFFLYFADYFGSGWLLIFLVSLNILLISTPYFWKPSFKIREEEYVSSVDTKVCQGCKQCYYDCPFDAIDLVLPGHEEMQNLATHRKSPYIPLIDPGKCVSCGLCAASCSVSAIGPELRTSRDLLARIKNYEKIYKSNQKNDKNKKNFFIVCEFNPVVKELSKIQQSDRPLYYSVTCAGVIHSSHLNHLTKQYEKIIIASCPGSNCTFRKGPQWLKERVEGIREPFLADAKDKDSIIILEDSNPAELFKFMGLTSFRSRISTWRDDVLKSLFGLKTARYFVQTMVALVVFTGIALFSQVNIHKEYSTGTLKLSWKIQGEKKEICHELTEQEIQKLPVHMRKKKQCQTTYLPYILNIKINNTETVREYKPAGLKSDRPILVYEELPLAPGDYSVTVEFFPAVVDKAASRIKSIYYRDMISIKKDRTTLLTVSKENQVIKKERTGIE